MAHEGNDIGGILALLLLVIGVIVITIVNNFVHVVILDGSRSPQTQSALFRYTLPDGTVIKHRDIGDDYVYYNATNKDMVYYHMFYESPGKNSKKSAHVGTGTIIKPHSYYRVSLSSTKPEHFFTRPPSSATFRVYSPKTTSSMLPLIDFLDKLPEYGLEYRQEKYGGYIYPSIRHSYY